MNSNPRMVYRYLYQTLMYSKDRSLVVWMVQQTLQYHVRNMTLDRTTCIMTLLRTHAVPSFKYHTIQMKKKVSFLQKS
jgi:hypothetical protein